MSGRIARHATTIALVGGFALLGAGTAESEEAAEEAPTEAEPAAAQAEPNTGEPAAAEPATDTSAGEAPAATDPPVASCNFLPDALMCREHSEEQVRDIGESRLRERCASEGGTWGDQPCPQGARARCARSSNASEDQFDTLFYGEPDDGFFEEAYARDYCGRGMPDDEGGQLPPMIYTALDG